MDLQALDNLAGDYSSFLSPRVLATNGGKVIDREQQIPVGSIMPGIKIKKFKVVG